jgi:hypothetical protein
MGNHKRKNSYKTRQRRQYGQPRGEQEITIAVTFMYEPGINLTTEGFWLLAVAAFTILIPILSAYMYGSWILYPLGETALARYLCPLLASA